jgi:hypothetical protein
MYAEKSLLPRLANSGYLVFRISPYLGKRKYAEELKEG